MAAAADEPIAGGRHKVFGHHDLAVIPQTSTIASHLPRAVGIAFAIERARELGVPCNWPLDAVVVCSFGDASLNHATAQSALNATAHFAYQRPAAAAPLRLRGQRPRDQRPDSRRMGRAVAPRSRPSSPSSGRGRRPGSSLATAQELVSWVREHRHPAVLHLRTVRFLSHAGADLETAYRSRPEIRADFERDPLLATGRWLAAAGARTGAQLAEDYLDTRAAIRERALEATRRPQIATAEDVMRAARPARPGRGRAPRARGRPAGEERADPCPGDQRGARRRPRAAPRDARLRRGRRREGRRLRGHARPPGTLRRRARVRHAARRDVDPRARARDGDLRLRPDPRDPVPRLPPQRGGPAPRRGGDAPVLLAGRVPQRDGRADRRATATRRGSAAISTTTTASACCATSRAS